jgi:ferredoxin
MPKLKIGPETCVVEVKTGQSFLDIDSENETPLLFGCMAGACGTCKIKVVEGASNISPMEDHERSFLESIDAQPDERLACQSKVLGDCSVLVQDYGTDKIFK